MNGSAAAISPVGIGTGRSTSPSADGHGDGSALGGFGESRDDHQASPAASTRTAVNETAISTVRSFRIPLMFTA
ncbi:hypothetical protein SAMN05421837_111125 [Amycolatopsis pretoriensis]|uniref:Uncharacterized protein n=1 Tax=Amycolatopsis pretoriensis TaxID=218821 RepID=A0A1H5RF99_9PSEU|nr:hypothetical protein [Amycolatopsis pretoriensis]SEF36704.1 hypothetical protein SAMN05421837_111125 [Amycolatopsis pretoriensis]